MPEQTRGARAAWLGRRAPKKPECLAWDRVGDMHFGEHTFVTWSLFTCMVSKPEALTAGGAEAPLCVGVPSSGEVAAIDILLLFPPTTRRLVATRVTANVN